MPSISNDYISIIVATKGAELQSLYHKQHKLEYMWSGDPAFWGKHSPVLFPIVGELKNKTYQYNGENYNLSRHGFAREMEFEVSEQSENSIAFVLQSNEETLEKYPFQFKFYVVYTLLESSLQITFIVENLGSDNMLFSVGAHPAFKVPLIDGTSFVDYRLVFDKTETIGRWPISPDGLIEITSQPLLNNETILPLKKEMFSADAIVLKELESTSISITSPKTEHGLKVRFENFPFLGIWSTKGADFVCIEPWCGIADSVNASGNFKEKEGINTLAPSGKFEVSYHIELF
ncbi:aldose 1-epimerase family protein [Segetibacter aerophilus]|uniref:Aldose 1-epimerase n=1 Tax=Segetibacter aerophilus TaxID=670293 RepID=A0A512BEF4_9BACT|nr:aldose 1-epimerase family protein [Segetibacter aerophilus]GEO10342.1 aldose 1-epimerase [Segetibacter aerophilus]